MLTFIQLHNCVPILKNEHNLGGKDSFELLNVMNAQNESEELKIDYIFNFDPIVNLGVRSKYVCMFSAVDL